MMEISLNMYHAVALGAVLFWIGGVITDKVSVLNRYCIPAPLVGGLLFSIINCILTVSGVASITFDGTLQTVFQNLFFTTVGFTVSIPALLRGGKSVVLVLILSIIMIPIQNALGGGIMLAMRYGIARGLFSNESGMGSAPLVASAAQTRNPVRQALVSSTGTFWDTVVVCAMTGMVLVTSIMKNPSIDVSNIDNGGVLTTLAFDQIPYIGPVILVLGLVLFAFSTVLGWAYYGERCVEYCMGKKALIPYRLLYILVAAIAPIVALDLVWTIADILNALMAIPNLIAVLLLSPVIVSETKKYLDNLDAKHHEDVPTIHR